MIGDHLEGKERIAADWPNTGKVSPRWDAVFGSGGSYIGGANLHAKKKEKGSSDLFWKHTAKRSPRHSI